ncbi:MAG: DNA internalization-related competence protein ComEC/Rec2 [Gammaproteobacteria bacterium]|jgi:competence protein ComEC
MPGLPVRCSIPLVALAFLTGISLFQPLQALPDPWWGLLFLPAPALVWRYRRLWPVLVVSLGFLWGWLHAALILHRQLPASLEGEDVTVQGMIASLPERDARRAHFEFALESLYRGKTAYPVPGRISLNWYYPEARLRVGDRWRLHVRLKRPHGLRNPGGFDYEAWLFRHHIRATGYVRHDEANRLLSSNLGDQPVNRLRQGLSQRITAALGGREFAGIVRALAVGDRAAIGHAQWQTLTATGTNHLVAISGLHVGIVAGIAFFLVRALWSRIPRLNLYWPAPMVAALAGVIAAIGYAAMAGFSIPTQRSVIMVMVGLGSLLLGRKIRPTHMLAWALLLVVLWDPLAVLEPGFWLSFAAVAVIFYGMGQRLAPRGLWWKWGRVQVLIALGLTPLLLILFQRVSLVAPLANLVAVPWVTLVVVPLTLLGSALLVAVPALGGLFLGLANQAMGWLWPILQGLAHSPMAQWVQPAPPPWAYVPALLGVIWMLAPRGMPGRWLGGVLLAPMVAVQPARPPPGEAWFTLLDVGQGLSAVVETTSHALVFDAGPATSGRFNAGSAVVIPFLRHDGINRVDTLVVSHGDMDHRGGVSAVLRQIQVRRLLTSVPDKIHWRQGRVESCVAGQSWRWDGVRFEMLYPLADQPYRGNDASCVLRVQTATQTALLPGDIERRSERLLLADRPAQLPSDILVAPHHGSTTSSTAAFVRAVDPDYVLFAVGYRNRYGFPKPTVAARYAADGARLLDSASDGAITFRLGSTASPSPDSFRRASRHYWNSR